MRLQQAGHDVAVVARGRQLSAIQAHGLRLEQGEHTWQARVQASDDPHMLGPQDVVFVTTKATALASVAQALGPLVAPHTQVVFVQNGMPWWYPLGRSAGEAVVPVLPQFQLADAFLRLLRVDQVVAGVLYSANEVREPGVIVNNSPARNSLELGSVGRQGAERVEPLRQLLAQARFESPPVTDIRTEVWAKLVLNACASSIAVITGSHTAIADDPDIRHLFQRAIEEACAVARAHGHEVGPKMDLSRWTAQRPRHKPSMLQDLEMGRPMEIAEIVEAPVAFGKAAGVACPTLTTLAALAGWRAVERGLHRRP